MCKGKFSILRVIVAILVATIALVSNLDIVNCDPRIVGGYEATFNNTKHQLSLRLKYADIYTFGNGHICGASLISNSRVLTASHCLYTSRLAHLESIHSKFIQILYFLVEVFVVRVNL